MHACSVIRFARRRIDLRTRIIGRFSRIESVRQRQLREVRRIGVVHDLRINLEADRHLDTFARLKCLLGKAETLYLVEVDTGRLW